MEQTKYIPIGNEKEHSLPWAGWSVWQVPTPSRRGWAKPLLGWVCHTFSVLLNSLSFLMLRFISLQFSSDNSKQFLISFFLWCMIFQIFIDVFPDFFFFFREPGVFVFSPPVTSVLLFWVLFQVYDSWRFLEPGSQSEKESKSLWANGLGARSHRQRWCPPSWTLPSVTSVSLNLT